MNSLASVLTLRDVQFGWSKGKPPLIDLEYFSIGPGETVFIAGPSGSGKSTLLSLVGGIVIPNRGQIELLGQDMAKLSGAARDKHRADNLGIVFQQFNLVPYLSIQDNVVLPCRFSKARRHRLNQAGTTPALESKRLLTRLNLEHPDLLNRPVTELSIGQQQRVAVARALIGGPSLIVADEPTSALDEDAREMFLSLLFDECRAGGAGVLFVSHDQRLAPLFDRQINLSEINRARTTPYNGAFS